MKTKTFILSTCLILIYFISGNIYANQDTSPMIFSGVGDKGKIILGKKVSGKIVAFKKDVEAFKMIMQKEISESVRETVVFTDVSILEVDGDTILLMKNAKYRTATLLQVDREGNVFFNEEEPGISCTTEFCSETDGCIPKGKKRCTRCYFGDCKKTTTGKRNGSFIILKSK